VKGFWSLTMYDPEHFFHPNALKRYALGTKNKSLQYNPGRECARTAWSAEKPLLSPLTPSRHSIFNYNSLVLEAPSTSSLSRPAQALRMLRPVGSLSHPEVTFVTRLLPSQLPSQVARQLPDLSTINGWNPPPSRMA
jgi:hypothetical protein